MIAPVLIAALSAIPLVWPAADPPPAAAGGGYGERASAFWMFPPDTEGAGRTFAFAEAYQGVNSSGPAGFAVVGLGVCIDYEREGRTSELCRGGGIGHELSEGEYESGPLLDAAHLAFEGGGHRNVIDWRATDPSPAATPHYGLGPDAGAADVNISRQASAQGSVLGYAVDESVFKAAILSRTAGGGGSVSLDEVGPYEVTRTVDGDGRFRITLERPL